MNNKKINLVHSTKFLGVFLDETLSWKPHISHINKKIAAGLSYLTRLRHFLPVNSLKTIYDAFIDTHIRYGIESWGTACNTTLDPLIKLQKRALRILHFLPSTTSTLEVFATDGILTVTQLAFYQLGIMMKKIVTDSAILPKVQPKNTRYSIRCHSDNNKPLYISKVRSNYGKQKIEFIGSKLWNNLDAPIKNLSNITAFKRELKHHIICNNANIYNLLKC